MASNNGRYKKKTISPDYSGAIAWALNRLEVELSPRLTYHNLWHTQEVVIPAATRLAQAIGVPKAVENLINVAVAFHDIGFVTVYKGHEAISVEIAVKTLPLFGFSRAQIKQVVGMILATRLPQKPQNIYEQIICDADLDALGREDFLQQNEALYQEVLAQGMQISRVNWLIGQVLFITQHDYFTDAARQWRNAQKQRNLAELNSQLEQAEALDRLASQGKI